MTARQVGISVAALLASLMLLSAASAQAAITSRQGNAANPRGWSAVAGMDVRSVREMARRLPLSDRSSSDQPWCGTDAEVETALRRDFREERIAIDAQDTALWGSERMGTWTMVLERPDATSCVIASGVGFSRSKSPATYFSKVGLGG